jgi:hypothetical protein
MTAPSDESLRLNTTAAMQWSYSLMHLAHHYEKGLRKFILTTEDRNTSILLEVTSLKACPEDVEGLNVLSRKDFVDPQTKESLGPLPILFVRYLYAKMDRPPMAAMKFVNHANRMDGGLMGITAASMDEINFGYEELKRGRTFVMGQKSKPGEFHCSVLFPAIITDVKKHGGKAPTVCANCNAVITKKPAPNCGGCKVTTYCNRGKIINYSHL